MTDDYLNVTEVTFGWEYFAESPAMLKMDGHYFLFGSHLTGWDPNDNVSSKIYLAPPPTWLLTVHGTGLHPRDIPLGPLV